MATETLAAAAVEHATHVVFNQPPPLEDYNVFATDRPLAEALRREGAGWAEERAQAFGALAGKRETIAWGVQANENRPVLRTHDRAGNRVDEVEFHPAWHSLLGLAVENGLHALPWAEPRQGAHVARAALCYTLEQIEAGVGCPLSMTYSVVPALRREPAVAAEWEPRLASLVYDPRLIPAREKGGVLFGMAMTEKQGGSDVRANTTRARPLAPSPSGNTEYELTGHKWFCSAPMCDAFLVLAQAPGGLTCFLLPRFTPDGVRNRFHIQRLKDKLGNRSNASSEIELRAAWARRIGEEGRGVPTILEMVMHTRLDCVTGSAASIRQGTVQAIHYAKHRRTFGRLLSDHALMQNVLADLAIESEAATVAMMRLARAYDEDSEPFKRLATPVLKYWICKRAPVHTAEALECLGGNGYVEEWPLARLYRDAPLNSIWEGSGNVQCLDVLRATAKTPEPLAVVLDEIDQAHGGDTRLDAHLAALRNDLRKLDDVETRARSLVERLALALQGSLLIRHAPAAVADAFCATRLGGEGGRAFGTLPAGTDFATILERNAA